jgi:hypothetical protein
MKLSQLSINNTRSLLTRRSASKFVSAMKSNVSSRDLALQVTSSPNRLAIGTPFTLYAALQVVAVTAIVQFPEFLGAASKRWASLRTIADLPDPDGPLMKTLSPLSMHSQTSSSISLLGSFESSEGRNFAPLYILFARFAAGAAGSSPPSCSRQRLLVPALSIATRSSIVTSKSLYTESNSSWDAFGSSFWSSAIS